MITFENFIASFIGSEVPDELMIDQVIIDHKKKIILVQGKEYVDNTLVASNYSVLFIKDADYEDNNATQDIVYS